VCCKRCLFIVGMFSGVRVRRSRFINIGAMSVALNIRLRDKLHLVRELAVAA
jgi:hypothetical protein